MTASAYSQTPSKTDGPKTQLESFAAETGAVIVKGYSTIGRLVGMGSIEVDAREFTNAQSRKKTYGMVIEVKESGRLERSDRSFIDYDEIPSLIAGIDYISKIKSDVTKLKNFEATYSTKGDFSITVFNDQAGKLSAAVTSGRIGRASAYFGIDQLSKLRELIVQAKEKIESIK